MDTFLEEIRRAEGGIVIKTTKEFVGDRKINFDDSAKMFRPSIFFKVFIYCVFGCPFLFMFYRVIQPQALTGSQMGGMLAGIIGLIIILLNAYNQFSLKEEMNYKIWIDKTGIKINDTLYAWENIYETAIMKKNRGKDNDQYLVIGLENMSTYESYDLTNFKSLNPFGFGMTLAKYIEHFKPLRTIKLRTT